MVALLGLVGTIVCAGVTAGLCFLQVYLSKKASPLPGLILPVLSFLFSAVAVIGMVNYSVVGTSGFSIATDKYEAGTSDFEEIYVHDLTTGEMIEWDVNDDGYIIDLRDGTNTGISMEEMEMSIRQNEKINETAAGVPVIGVVMLFVMINLPTIVYFIIYAVCRRRFGAAKQLAKMELQDM